MLPGLMWVDFGLKYIREGYKRAFPAYYYSRTATYAPPTSGTIWWWAATSKIRNRESVAYPPGDGVLTYGQRQGDLRHNSVDHRRR